MCDLNECFKHGCDRRVNTFRVLSGVFLKESETCLNVMRIRSAVLALE